MDVRGEEGGDIFAEACVIFDRLDKIGVPAITELLAGIGVSADSASDILKALQAPTVDALTEHIGYESDLLQVESLWMERRFDADAQEEGCSQFQTCRPGGCKTNGLCRSR